MPTRNELAQDLRNLGVDRGDLLAVHSSLRSLGHVPGGAAAVVDAILDVVGSDGTIVMPAFVRERGPEARRPRQERSIVTGAIPAALVARPGARRSFAGPGSFVVYGALATELVEEEGPRFVDGPLGQVYWRQGRILMLGVGQRRNTSLHIAEELAGLYPPSYHGEAFGKMDALLDEWGLLATGTVGRADAQLMDAAGVVDATVALLRTEPLALWCGNESCPRCGAVLAAGSRPRR